MKTYAKSIFVILGLLLIISVAIWGLGGALFTLILSFGLSYLLFPLIKKLESKGIKREHAIFPMFLSILLASIFLLSLVIPNLITESQRFVKDLPRNASRAIDKVERISLQAGYEIDLSKNSIQSYLKKNINKMSGSLLDSISKGLKVTFSGLASWLIAILNLFLIPVFFFYVMSDYEKISGEIKSCFPSAILPKVTHYMELCNNVLQGYIRGQLMVALILAALYALGLSMVGLKFGILIGIISGLISVIPYAGFSLGFLAAIVTGLAHNTGYWPIFGIVIVFVIVQTLESFLITPKLVGNKVGLSSFATMLALIIGGNLLGIMGMLVAIPIAAIMKSVVIELKEEFHQLDWGS